MISIILWVLWFWVLLSFGLLVILFLCIVVNECSSVVFVGSGMILMVFLWYVIVLVFRVSLKVLLVLSKPLLIPHTRVCGLSWGRCFNSFMCPFILWWGIIFFCFLSTAMGIAPIGYGLGTIPVILWMRTSIAAGNVLIVLILWSPSGVSNEQRSDIAVVVRSHLRSSFRWG